MCISMDILNLVKFLTFLLKILSVKKVLTSLKGPNAVNKLRKMVCGNPNLDFVNFNVYIKFGHSVYSFSRY